MAFLGETPIVAWSQPSVGNVLLYSHKDGNAWSIAKEIPTGGWPISNARNPNLISNQDKTKLSIVWLDYRSLPGNIYIADYDEASDSFINDQAVTGVENKPSGYPRGAYDSSGNLWVVWSEYKSGEGEQIYYTKRDPSGNWSEISPVSPFEYSQQNPDIDAQGKHVVVVWEQDSATTGRDAYASELSSPPQPKEPILIVPGMNASISEELLTNWQSKWELWPVLGTGVYKGLTKTLTGAGYEEGSTLFTVPYDWRKPHTEIAEIFLKPMINKAKQYSPTGKVDIVAHSQGGIVSRAYIESQDYEDDIDTLITVGSPHLGTPKTYYLWEGMETPPGYNLLMRGLHATLVSWYYWIELGQLSDYEVSQKYFPSFKELLPVYDFLRDEQGNLVDFSTMNNVNSFLMALNNRGDRMLRVTFKNLVGTGFDTAHIVNVRPHSWEDGELWIDGYPTGEEYSDGDRTVNSQSATSEFAEEVQALSLNHTQLMIEVEGVKKICEMLGVEVTEYFPGKATEDYAHIIIHSPATLLVTTPSGKSIGFDPNTQTYINETENAELAGQDEEYKWLTIGDPEEGHYQVKIIGTGEGSYHFTTIVENPSEFAIKEIQGTTQENQQDLIELLVDPDDPDEIEIIDPSGQIQEKSVILKIGELTTLSENDGFDFLAKRLKKILKFTEQGKAYQAIETLYEARKEITFRVSSQSKRVFYKDYLDSIAEDLTEIYATNSKAKRQVAKAQILVAEKVLSKAREIIEKRPSYEASEILKLGEGKLVVAKVNYDKESYARTLVLATQARWLGNEALEALLMKFP